MYHTTDFSQQAIQSPASMPVFSEHFRRTDNRQTTATYTATTEKDGGGKMCELERQNLEARQKSHIFHEGCAEMPTNSKNCRLFFKKSLPGEAALHNAKLVTQMSKGLALYGKTHESD